MQVLNSTVFSRPLVEQAFEESPAFKDFFFHLTSAAPAPVDYACAHLVAMGAIRAAFVALRILNSPNEICMHLISGLTGIEEALTFTYQQNNTEDLHQPVLRNLGAYPAWRALASLGTEGSTEESARNLLLGIELLIKIHKHHPMSRSFCDKVRIDPRLDDMPASALEKIQTSDFEKRPTWLTRFFKQRVNFILLFDANPRPEDTVEDFQTKVTSHFVNALPPKSATR